MAARAQDAPQGDAAAGKQLYLSTGCFYCHGRSGQGGAYNREAPSLAKTIVPYLGFKQQLRSPSGDMPAYAETVMSEQDRGHLRLPAGFAWPARREGLHDPQQLRIVASRACNCVFTNLNLWGA